MNKFAILSLIVIFILLIVLKVNFFWFAILAIAAAYFVRQHLRNTKQQETDEESLKEVEELEKSSPKMTVNEEKAEFEKLDKEIGYDTSSNK